MRLLFDPAPGDGGGAATPNPEALVVPPAEPVKPPAPTPNPLAADVAALRSKLAEFEAKEAERAEQTRLAEEKKLTEKGEFDKLLKQRDEQLASERKNAQASADRARTYALSSQLAIAFSAHDLYPGSSEDLSKLWRDDFEAVPDGDGFTVRAKDGRPVKDVIAERLASDRYANHVKATSRGGSGGGDGHRPAPTPAHDPSKPVSLLDAAVARLKLAPGTQTFGLRGRVGS